MTITLSPRVFRLTVAVLLITVGVAAGMAVSAAMAAAAPVQDTAYTTITPCASFDSRSDTGTLAGKYGQLESRTIQISGAAPAAQQGGVDCGVPITASAVLINIVAIAPDTIGNLRAFASGETGSGGVVNYSPVSPSLNNSNAVVIPLSASGQLDIQNNCGGCAGVSVHARGVILGYYSDSLAARVTALEALLADVTRDSGGPNATDRLLFTGMNVQIVDGSGDTACKHPKSGNEEGTLASCSGSGNLIVGYNEVLPAGVGGTLARSGAHNLIVGTQNDWTAHSGVAFGRYNTTSGSYASVTAGQNNMASGIYSSVTGGRGNTASGLYLFAQGESIGHSTVSGGVGNTASGLQSSVSGGNSNIASASYSTISGGLANKASGFLSAVSGGNSNTASGSYSSVSGGHSLSATLTDGWIAGGMLAGVTRDSQGPNGTDRLLISGMNVQIVDGTGDTYCTHANGGSSEACNGLGNLVIGYNEDDAIDGTEARTGAHGLIVGYNHDWIAHSNVVLGWSNAATGSDATVTGGANNAASGASASVSGGGHRDSTTLTSWSGGSFSSPS